MLEISSSKQSGYFYIKNGEIKGGEIGKVRGAAAVELAGSLADASFQFRQLEPTDYARVVWEKSFGPNRVVDTPDIRVKAFRTMLEQFLSYAEEACGILERAVVLFAQRTLRQLLFYAPAGYRNLEKTGVIIARRTLAYYTAAYEFSKSAVRKKLLPSLRSAPAAWQIALCRNKQTILKYARALSFQRALTLIQKVPSLQQVAQSNISFGVILVALFVGTAVTISKIQRSNQDHVDRLATTDENIGTQSQAQPSHVSRERTRGKPRIGRQTLTEKKRDGSMSQEPKFLPQVAAVQAPVNAASDSDVPKKQLATTPGVQNITVVLQIENGRVSQASLLEHRTSLEAYEAAALQIARQRRYHTTGKHTETLVVKVYPPNPK